jgi:hypothetical protein
MEIFVSTLQNAGAMISPGLPRKSRVQAWWVHPGRTPRSFLTTEGGCICTGTGDMSSALPNGSFQCQQNGGLWKYHCSLTGLIGFSGVPAMASTGRESLQQLQ